jgi:hypothetical protein
MDHAHDEQATLLNKEIHFIACDTIYMCSHFNCIFPQRVSHTNSGYPVDCHSLVSGLPFYNTLRFLQRIS